MTSTLSLDAKDGLARELPQTLHCRKALLVGLLLYGVTEHQSIFSTQRLTIARLAKTLFERPIHKRTRTRLRRPATYEIDVTAFLPALGKKPTSRCDRRAEIRAAFLTCGSVSEPQRGYHLEFVPPTTASTKRLLALLQAEGRAPKLTLRNQRPVIYFKSIDEITQVLSSIGAFNAVFHLEGTRALKETKNRIHRLVNTEAANVDRSVHAATRQRELIAFLADAHGLHTLPPALREIALLRLEHPTGTLTEIGQYCRPPAGKTTVSARFAALAKLVRKRKTATLLAPTEGSEADIR